MSNNNNDKYTDEHKDDSLKFSELFFKKNYSENKNNDIQKFIIVGTPTFDSSEFENIFQSAIEEGCGIAIFKPSQEDDIHIEHIPNQEVFGIGISKASIKQLSFIDYCYHIEQLNSTMQEQLCDFLYEEQKLLKELPKKKKTFQENFGYVKRKFR